MPHAPETTRSAVSEPSDHVVIDIRDHTIIDLRGEQAPRDFIGPDTGILGAPRWQLTTKRLIDIVAASFFIILFAPVMLAAALAVKLTSKGPLLFVQERVGKDGQTFRFMKFRSMYNGSHDLRGELSSANEVVGPVFKIKQDPRITPVGRIMRRFSIDELPQFFHVLSGRMSLVGPRPPLPEEVAHYGEWERQRLLVKPGITCIWQVSGRSDVPFETWVEMDIEYISRWSPKLDLSILLKTIPAALSGKGAY